MPPVPPLRPAEVARVFEKFGWRVVRQRGSHVILTRTGSIATLSIPDHPQVARGTFRMPIDRSGVTAEAFLKILDDWSPGGPARSS